jgi:hypothetical protein
MVQSEPDRTIRCTLASRGRSVDVGRPSRGPLSLAGTAGAVVFVTVWLYVNGQIFLGGAVMTMVLTEEVSPSDETGED